MKVDKSQFDKALRKMVKADALKREEVKPDGKKPATVIPPPKPSR